MPRRLPCWLIPLAAVGLVGCGTPPNPPTPPTDPVAVTPGIVTPADPPATKPTPDPTKPADPPITLPSDLGGQMVEKALATPAALPTDPPAKPRAYASTFDRSEVPLPGVAFRPFTSTPPAVTSAKPTPPREKTQLDRTPPELPGGKLSDRPLVKADSPSNPGAADVPGRTPQQPDRVSLADPTADLTAGRVIQTALPLAVFDLPFLQLIIPDPFEFVAHLRGKLGRDGELGTKPPQ